MSPEDTQKLEKLLQQYLELNDCHINKEIWENTYHIKKNKIAKDKEKTNDYVIDRYFKEFTLATDKDTNSYRFWQFVYKKDIQLGRDMVPEYINIPGKDYLRDEYIKNVFQLYTNNKNENHILWSIINTRKFLNNNIKVVEQLFKEHVLAGYQKEHVVKYYVELLDKNTKFNNLENKRIISVLNESLTKPLTINLLDSQENSEKLKIKTKISACVYFEIQVQELMAYNLKFSRAFAEHLLENFTTLLPKVPEAETTDVIDRKLVKNNEILGYSYAVLTYLNQNVIDKTFTNFVDSYAKSLDSDRFLSKEEMLDCLKFSVIKARKESLENKLVDKNIKTKVNKI